MNVKCPTCQSTVAWSAEEKYKPFCSERCKLIDLGDWMDEKHRIVDEQPPQDFISSNNSDEL